MLASPMPKKPLLIKPGTHIAEEKYDGHRLIMEVSDAANDNLFETGRKVQAWGRYGIPRILPSHIVEHAQLLPVGIYDGELRVPGKRSYGVTEIINGPDLVYTIFDLLQLRGTNTMDVIYKHRRTLIEKIADTHLPDNNGPVHISHIWQIADMEEAMDVCGKIWQRDGEGIIIKALDAVYQSDKRPKHAFIKIKKLEHEVLTVIGFEPGELGPCSRIALEDAEGHVITVKTLNDRERASCENDPQSYMGRRLIIGYQERTPDGLYRHPRMVKWEV